MHLHQLEYVIAVAEEGGFSRAAERLAVTQPSLSQQIKKLEEEVGTPLFDRLVRHVVPTQACERLLVHAQRIFTELAQIADVGKAEKDGGAAFSGVLRVGAIPTIAPFILPKILDTFARKYPGIILELVEDVSDRLVERLERGELDLAIMSSYASHQIIHLETIAVEQLCVVMSAKHPLAKRPEKYVAWEDLKDERIVVLHEMHCLSGQVTKFCVGNHLRSPVVMRGAQLSTLAATVAGGLGISLVPEMMANHDTTPDRVYRSFKENAPEREINLAWNLLRYRTAPSRAFADAISQTIKGGVRASQKTKGVVSKGIFPVRAAA